MDSFHINQWWCHIWIMPVLIPSKLEKDIIPSPLFFLPIHLSFLGDEKPCLTQGKEWNTDKLHSNLQLKPGKRSASKVLPFREAAYLPSISMWKSVSFLRFVNTCLSHPTKSPWIELCVCKMNPKLKQAIDILCSHPREVSFFCWQWSMTFKFCLPQQAYRKLQKELQGQCRKHNFIILF